MNKPPSPLRRRARRRAPRRPPPTVRAHSPSSILPKPYRGFPRRPPFVRRRRALGEQVDETGLQTKVQASPIKQFLLSIAKVIGTAPNLDSLVMPVLTDCNVGDPESSRVLRVSSERCDTLIHRTLSHWTDRREL